MTPKHLAMYMEMAKVAANASYANRLKVGALAVKDHRVLSVGYNGTPAGLSNECENELGLTNQNVIHAEMNLIYKMARDGQSGAGADIFITHSPCFECAKAILSVGFCKVWFDFLYRDASGIDLLTNNGVEVERLRP